MRKVIFLDRDGTLIFNKHYLNSVDGIEYLPGVFEALSSLKNAGYEFVMVTNQSGVPRGLVTEEQLQSIHDQMINDFKKHDLQFLDIHYAPYLPEDNHPDRKPSPGMLLKAQKKWSIDMPASWMIGDSLADIGAGQNSGVRPIVITSADQTEAMAKGVPQFSNWSKITDYILSQDGSTIDQ